MNRTAEISSTAEALAPVRALFDEHVVAHEEVKDALLLALVCREHLYVEGPPGTAKTRLAELAARATGQEFFFYQLHRDTRLAELVGDIVLERRPGTDGGEIIHQRVEPGGILTAEVCVLDDISRAPGEALNVLLRILNERKFGDQPIALRTAIATSNPMEDEYYNEPLDPANIDRFALQLRVRGLIQEGAGAARELIDRFADGRVVEHPVIEPVASAAMLDEAHQALAGVDVPSLMRQALVDVLRTLVVELECDETNSLLSDRSFLVKAVKLMRGRALLAGRREVTFDDLNVLCWMTTFRVPEDVHKEMPNVLERVRSGVGPQR